MRLFPILLAIALSSVACKYNALEGSISDSLSLDFHDVEIRKQDKSFIVEYVRNAKKGDEKVCKLVVDMEGLDVPKDGIFDLDEDGFIDHVALQRSTFKNESFPDLKSGALHFDQINFEHGGIANGEFQIIFVNSRSLNGWFDGVIQEL